MIAVYPAFTSLLPNYTGYTACIAFIGIAVVYSVGTIIGRWEWYWKLAIALHAADAISSTAWRLSQEWWGWRGVAVFIRNTVTPLVGIAAVLMILSAIVMDLHLKRHRDWFHWCGLPLPLFKWYGATRAYVLPNLI